MRNEDFYDNENAEGLVFENAIEQNKLSLDLDDDRYVGRYMYMHSTLLDDDQIIDHFKNIDTRAYDVVSTRKEVKEDSEKCILCGGSIGEWGNNPYPLAEEGECCSTCNTERVVPERIRQREQLLHPTETVLQRVRPRAK